MSKAAIKDGPVTLLDEAADEWGKTMAAGRSDVYGGDSERNNVYARKDPGFGDRLLAVAQACRRLGKRGHNDHFDYDYVTEADVKRLVGDALVANGLVVGTVETTMLSQETYTNAKGKPQHRVVVSVTVFINDMRGRDYGYAKLTGIGAGVDGEDKAPYKAMAGALKYALTMGFLIATGDDPERDSEMDLASIEGLKAAMPALVRAGRMEELKTAVAQFRDHPDFNSLRAAFQSAVKDN